MEDPQPGSTAERPLYVRWATGEDGGIRWGRVALALTLTVASGYLAARAQRAGGRDPGVPPRARAYHALHVYAGKQVAAWQRLESFAKTGYEISTL